MIPQASSNQMSESKHDNERPVAWVMGGSAGFGLILAAAVARSGYRVVIFGRDPDRLNAGRTELAKQGHPDCDVESLDVLDLPQVRSRLEQRYRQDQRLDLLVNCVGKSCRVAADAATPEMYHQWMQVNFQSAVNTTMVSLPWLEAHAGGVINIGSLASRVPWRWIGPYAASKRALASFTDTLRIEMRGRLRVLLVCPGPISRTDSETRYQEVSQGMDTKASRPGAGAPVTLLDGEKLAGQILEAYRKGQGELLVPGKTRWLMAAYAWSTGLGDWLLGRIARD